MENNLKQQVLRVETIVHEFFQHHFKDQFHKFTNKWRDDFEEQKLQMQLQYEELIENVGTKYQEQITEKDTSINLMETLIQNLEQRKQTLEMENASLSQQLQEWLDSYKKLNTIKTGLEQKIHQMEGESSQNENKIQSLKKQLKDKNGKIHHLEETVKEKQIEMDHLKRRVEEMEKANEELTLEKEDLTEKIGKLETNEKDLEAQLNQWKDKFDALQIESHRFQFQVEAKDSKIQSLQAMLDGQKRQFQYYQERNEKCEKENDDLRREVREVNGKMEIMRMNFDREEMNWRSKSKELETKLAFASMSAAAAVEKTLNRRDVTIQVASEVVENSIQASSETQDKEMITTNETEDKESQIEVILATSTTQYEIEEIMDERKEEKSEEVVAMEQLSPQMASKTEFKQQFIEQNEPIVDESQSIEEMEPKEENSDSIEAQQPMESFENHSDNLVDFSNTTSSNQVRETVSQEQDDHLQ